MTAVARPAGPRLLAGGQAAVLIAGNGIGAACVLANWWRAADDADLSSDLSSAGLAIVGLVVAGLANALWLVSGRAAIARRRLRLSSRVTRWATPLGSGTRPEVVPPAAASPAAPRAARATEPLLISVEGASLYHRPGCPLVTRKPTAAAPAGTHERNGLRPCGVCEPALSLNQDGTQQ